MQWKTCTKIRRENHYTTCCLMSLCPSASCTPPSRPRLPMSIHGIISSKREPPFQTTLTSDSARERCVSIQLWPVKYTLPCLKSATRVEWWCASFKSTKTSAVFLPEFPNLDLLYILTLLSSASKNTEKRKCEVWQMELVCHSLNWSPFAAERLTVLSVIQYITRPIIYAWGTHNLRHIFQYKKLCPMCVWNTQRA